MGKGGKSISKNIRKCPRYIIKRKIDINKQQQVKRYKRRPYKSN